ncbi:MAG: carboxypeptidase-like regulatory domain-containing protein [Bacteroidales bacterium]|nr:carboxypeptidase-like regulatory domain-containing protein [Bacteroidales bacterium]
MNKIHFIYLLLLFNLPFLISTAQVSNGEITGKIVQKSTNTPLEFVTLALYTLPDSTLVNGAISLPDGSFKISGVEQGKYFLKISFIGFDNKIIDNIQIAPASKSLELNKIILQESKHLLDEVTIETNRSTVSYKLDKKVITASQDIKSQGGTALDVLANAPSVQTDASGEVSLKGSTSFTVFINGKPSPLDASEALSSIPANFIDNIEIITNPSAKYDSEGGGGIVNIITKQNAIKGMNGIIEASYGSLNQYSGNILLEYTHKKLNIFAGFTLENRPFKSLKTTTINYTDTSSLLNSEKNSDQQNTRSGMLFKSGLSYLYKENSFLSLSWNFGTRNMNRNSITNTSYSEISGKKYSCSKYRFFT